MRKKLLRSKTTFFLKCFFWGIIGGFLSNPILLFAQTGPAGVGDASNNVLWLKADAISGLSNNAPVSTWLDMSGNGNNATQGNVNNQPTFQSNSNINSRPAVRFDGLQTANGDRLTVADSPKLDGMSGLTMFVVMNPDAVTTSGNGILTKREGYNSNECYGMYIIDENPRKNLHVYMPGADNHLVFQQSSFSNGTSSLISVKFDGSVPSVSGWVDGSGLTIENGSVSINTIPDNSSSLIIGQLIGNNVTHFDGDIAEIIFYDEALNEARQIIVENYLAAKYGIAISNDNYNGDLNGYIIDVAGIGTTDGTLANKHASAANSAGLNIGELNTSLDVANEYIFVGHNSVSNSESTNDLVSSNAQKRMQRLWYLDKTGTVDVRLTFDLSDADLSGTAGEATEYVLLYRSGTSGDFSDLVSEANEVNGDQISFNVDNVDLKDGYYTLGAVNIDSPLPVELTGYTLENSDDGVRLNWSTATEVDNLGFILERSTESNSGFEQIASYQSHSELQGQGTVSVESQYSYVDFSKFVDGQTYYYRLSDVNISGNRNVLETKSITRPQAYSLEQNYPNPFNPVTSIQFNLEQPGQTVLEVYDILGRKVATLLNEQLKAGSHIQNWDARNFASGVYFYRLQSGGFVKVKKMMLTK